MKLDLRDPLFWVTHGLAAGALAFALYVSPVNAQMASGFGGGWVPKSGGTFVGPVTNTGQPAFVARVTATIPNVTGNGTVYTIVFNAVEQQGSGFNVVTGVYTASVAGYHLFAGAVNMEGVGSATNCTYLLQTSNRSYRLAALNAGAADTAGGDYNVTFSTIAYLDAADTASVGTQCSGIGADTADVSGNAGTSLTTFSGALLF
jgi:hypothetical protein